MVSGLTVLIFVCTFLIPEIIVLGWRKFLSSIYEAKNGTINLVYHLICMLLLMLEFQTSFNKTIILWGFICVAFIGIFTLLVGVMAGREGEFLISENRFYKSLKKNYERIAGISYGILLRRCEERYRSRIFTISVRLTHGFLIISRTSSSLNRR